MTIRELTAEHARSATLLARSQASSTADVEIAMQAILRNVLKSAEAGYSSLRILNWPTLNPNIYGQTNPLCAYDVKTVILELIELGYTVLSQTEDCSNGAPSEVLVINWER